ASGSLDRTARIWDVKSGSLVASLAIQQAIATDSDARPQRLAPDSGRYPVPAHSLSGTIADIVTETALEERDSIFVPSEDVLERSGSHSSSVQQRTPVPKPLSTRIPMIRPGG